MITDYTCPYTVGITNDKKTILRLLKCVYLPEISDKTVFLWQVQEVDEEIYSGFCFFGWKTMDPTEKPQCVANSELIVQSYVL